MGINFRLRFEILCSRVCCGEWRSGLQVSHKGKIILNKDRLEGKEQFDSAFTLSPTCISVVETQRFQSNVHLNYKCIEYLF
jgi:hypothetical protein